MPPLHGQTYLPAHGRPWLQFPRFDAIGLHESRQFSRGSREDGEGAEVHRYDFLRPDQSGRERRLLVTAYVEWVLASAQRQGRTLIATEIDPLTGAMLVQNRWNGERGESKSVSGAVS